MPRSPRVPAYSLHRPSGRAVVKVPCPVSGKQRSIYLGKHGSPESHDAYAKVIADLIAGRPVEAPRSEIQGTPTLEPTLTVAALAAAYLKHARGYYRKAGRVTSEVSIISRAAEFLTAQHANLDAERFGIGDLKVVRAAMIHSGLSRTAVNKYVGRIVACFKWGATEEMIPASVYETLAILPGLKAGRTIAREPEPVKPVDPEVVTATLPYMPEIVADMVKLQLLTGARPEEVCCIRPGDVDRTGTVWEYRPASHKCEHHGRERVIYIGPAGQKVLAAYLLRPADEHCFQPRRHIAVPKSQKRYRVDSYRQAIQRACDRAFPAPKGLEGDRLRAWQKQHRWAPNQLRHTAGTAVRRQFGLEASQVVLGHAKAVVTEHYAERDSQKAREVAALIG